MQNISTFSCIILQLWLATKAYFLEILYWGLKGDLNFLVSQHVLNSHIAFEKNKFSQRVTFSIHLNNGGLGFSCQYLIDENILSKTKRQNQQSKYMQNKIKPSIKTSNIT